MLNATTQITEYNQTAAALSELRSRFENVIFPVETTKGMKDATTARKELRELRVGLEKTRQQIKAPALERCRLIDAEAKDITAQLVALEEPIDAQIKAEEQKKEVEKQAREKAERERVAVIQARITGINGLIMDSANDTADQIQATIEELMAMPVEEAAFGEFVQDAQKAKDFALESLSAWYVTVSGRETEAARMKAEAERLRAEREAFERQQAEEERKREEVAAAERARLKEEAEKLAAERAELDRQRAELEAGKAGQGMALDGVAADGQEGLVRVRPASAPTYDNGAPMFSETTFKDNGDPIMLNPDGTRSIFCDVDEGEEPATIIGADMAAGDDQTVVHAIDADALVSELAKYTAMQFTALARKVRAVGFVEFEEELIALSQSIAAGEFNDVIKSGSWLEVSNADKEMALASHACVALIIGDEEMGASVLRAAE